MGYDKLNLSNYPIVAASRMQAHSCDVCKHFARYFSAGLWKHGAAARCTNFERVKSLARAISRIFKIDSFAASIARLHTKARRLDEPRAMERKRSKGTDYSRGKNIFFTAA